MVIDCVLPKEAIKRNTSRLIRQKTIGASVSISGRGLFSGEEITLTLHPAEVNSGVVFQRVDLIEKPIIPAKIDHVVGTPRCTVLGKEKATIQTVEHLLSALKALEIDNVRIEISGSEVPILDGSSRPYVQLIEKAGIIEQRSEKKFYRFTTPFFWSQGDIHLIALPSESYRISYTLHYPKSNLLRSQYVSIEVTPTLYKQEIAPCRTFCLYEEVAPLIEKGYIKGGSLENGVIIQNDKVLNPEGLRFPDEMARHKVLDLIGDLSLMPFGFYAHIIAIRSGHASNVAFAKELFNHIKMENS